MQERHTHHTHRGEDTYAWVEGMPTGFKSSLSATAPVGVSGSAGNQISLDVNKKADYRCSPWAADNSKFTLPTNIQFQEMGQMMIPL